MPAAEIKALTEAIDGLRRYYGDSRWTEVLSRAAELETDVKDLMESSVEPTPGERAATDAGRGEDDKPAALKNAADGEQDKKEDSPKNFREAGERASERFSRDDSARGDSATADDKEKEGDK